MNKIKVLLSVVCFILCVVTFLAGCGDVKVSDKT